MKQARELTPAREHHVRALSAISTQMHDHVTSLGETIRLRHAERRHSEENIRKAADEVQWIQHERKFSSASERESLDSHLEKAKTALDLQRARDETLRDEINKLVEQQKASSEAWQRCGSLVDAVVRAFGPAGEDVGMRIRGQA